MNNKLKNIFVPYNVAKLAFEKGFTNWCAGLQKKEFELILNTHPILNYENDYQYFGDDNDGEYGIPTHFQLIAWLYNEHSINVMIDYNGLWKVYDFGGRLIYFEFENEFEINQALEVALNLLPYFQHDKQEYL